MNRPTEAQIEAALQRSEERIRNEKPEDFWCDTPTPRFHRGPVTKLYGELLDQD